MKRDPALEELSRDHHEALYRAMRMKRASDADRDEVREDVLAFWSDHGARHFRIEEEASFRPSRPGLTPVAMP